MDFNHKGGTYNMYDKKYSWHYRVYVNNSCFKAPVYFA